MGDPDRRRFLQIATCSIGGGLGIAIVAPALRACVDPVGRATVTTPDQPLVVGPVTSFEVGAPPRRVDVIAPRVQDAWTSANDVLLGAAFIRRLASGKIEALSSVCPHLGCVVGWDDAKRNFLCPCHDSRFAMNGDRLTGPSQRGLDPLPVEISKDGKLAVTWVRYKMGGAKPEKL
jgi:Rieske Fe-S protein